MFATGGIIGLFVLLVEAVIGLATFAFWLWMLIDSITNKGVRDGEKIAWVLVVILVPCIGPVVYFFVGKPKGSP